MVGAIKQNISKRYKVMVSIEVIGNLGADVKRVDANGVTFYSFNVCDNRKVNGNETSMWYTCNLNKVSDKLLPYLKKGQAVFVRGLPRYRVFDSAVHHCKMVGVEVFVNEIQLIGQAPADNLQAAAETAMNQDQPF